MSRRPGWVYRNNAHPRPDDEGTVTFGQRQQRLDRLDNWELLSWPGKEDEPSDERMVMPAAWAEVAPGGDGADGNPRRVEPDPVGAQLVVITRPARRSRKGVPPATIEDTSGSGKA